MANPAEGQLSCDQDRAVIESLTDVAARSTAFTCWRLFVKEQTTNIVNCLCGAVCCCYCCGMLQSQHAAVHETKGSDKVAWFSRCVEQSEHTGLQHIRCIPYVSSFGY